MLIQDQFGTIQSLQTSPISQTSFLVGTFFAVSYSKTALAILFLVHFGHSKPLCSKAACLFASPYCVYCAYLGKLLSSALHSGNIFSWFHIAQFLIARCYNSSKSIEISLEMSCCKKRQKSPNQETGLGNRGRLKVLNAFILGQKIYNFLNF